LCVISLNKGIWETKFLFVCLSIMIGKRIKLIKMDDPDPVEPGTLGTVIKGGLVQNEMIYVVEWDNGRGLNLIEGIDKYEIIE
jgi:hypothetical protein